MRLETGEGMEAVGRPHFGALLRLYRLDVGMTQQDLAERAALSVEAISTLERGARTRPHRDTVALIARALALSPEREAQLESAVGVAHPSRQRERAEPVNASLLRIVHPDPQSTPRHNLPELLTSFVGRRREVGEIVELVREHRLVTIVGSGGVGKTRVAAQVGREVLGGCADAVWLVDLAPLTDHTLVAGAVLTALQRPATTGSSLDAVVAYLRERELLLILDNCEHVLARTRDVAARIVQACPHVRILSTSRAALFVAGERAYQLPPLAVPPPSPGSADEVAPFGAVALFIDRARAVDAGFTLTDDNASDVAEICRRLDGIPLALELAAARVRMLAPRQIAQRLDQRFRLLTGGDPRALPRHQTMTALIDWSYDLLSPREQLFFESLSVFAGGCTLEAATAVCAVEAEDDLDAIDLIASLVTKSLLLAELVGDERRYRLLESSRQYAADKLIARGEHDQMARRHAVVYLELAQRLDLASDNMADRAWAAQANVELENWRAVLECALVARRDVLVGQRLAASRKVMWRSFSPVEGRRWVRAAIESIDDHTPPEVVARLEHAEADGAQQFGDRKVSLAAAERALIRYRELGDALGSTQAATLAGAALALLGRAADAEPLLREALDNARTLSDRRLTANVLQTVGWSRSSVGDFAGARIHLTEALGLANALGSELFAASIAGSLADNEFDAGDAELALRLSADVLATLRAINTPTCVPGIATTLTNMATYLVAMHRFDDARAHANEALEIASELRLGALSWLPLRILVLVAVLEPQAVGKRPRVENLSTARLFGFLDAHLSTVTPEKYGLQDEYDRALSMLRDALGVTDLTRLMAAGATMSEDEAIRQAQAIQ
jgi:predicted ATPase/transcriptional regulator with XRE-family HTH domain